MSSLTAVDAQRLARLTARSLAEGHHTVAGLEALLRPVEAACRNGWYDISITADDGSRVILDQLRRRLEDMIEAAAEGS